MQGLNLIILLTHTLSIRHKFESLTVIVQRHVINIIFVICKLKYTLNLNRVTTSCNVISLFNLIKQATFYMSVKFSKRKSYCR